MQVAGFHTTVECVKFRRKRSERRSYEFLLANQVEKSFGTRSLDGGNPLKLGASVAVVICRA